MQSGKKALQPTIGFAQVGLMNKANQLQ